MYEGGLIRDFSNIGLASPARMFPGFPSKPEVQTLHIRGRQAVRIALKQDDMLSLSASDPTEIGLVVVDADGNDGSEVVGIKADEFLCTADFESDELCGWLAGRGLGVDTCLASYRNLSELTCFKASAACTIWIVVPVGRMDFVGGKSAQLITVSVQRASGSSVTLPEPLGEVRDEFTVRRGTARAYEVAEGEMVQIIDVEGQQCSDFMAFRAAGLDHGQELMIDSTATRSMVRRAYPGPGLSDKFFDRDMRPMLRVLQDTCGRHDTLGLACTARGYEDRGFPGHLNCSDNISTATGPFGVAPRAAWPAINFFWNTWIDENNHHIMTEESYSRPGDYVVLRAMDQLICVSTACPDDIDPINGWNPTDIHVRIYRSDAPIRRAVAYRMKEDAPMSISRESAFHARTSELTQHFAPARDLWTPVSFPATGTTGEYWACREKVTLQDMSGLRKYDIVGPDAQQLLQLGLTRDVARLAEWRGTYALICDETGAVVDDGTLFRLGPELFRWCCGTEESARRLEKLAADHGLNVRLRDMSDGLVNLALQGPRSRDVLRDLIFTQPHVPALKDLRWFGATVARLRDREGAPFMLARSGYTGELGYELFCAPSNAVEIWDALMTEGAPHGLVPMGNAALDILRVEAGLASANAEFGPGSDAFESGLGFAVDLKKAEFVGKAALERNAQAPRRVLKGLMFQCFDVPLQGAPVFVGERQIGVVTSAVRSPKFERTIAMARLAVEHAEEGTELQVGMMDGHMKRLPCQVVSIPFYDPKRERARA